MDFGFTNDPTAYTRSVRSHDKKILYITDAIGDKGWTNPEIARRLKPIINDELIRCDNEPKSIMELRQNGINAIGAIKGPGSVNFGIQWLQQFDQIIIDNALQQVINEFTVYQWTKNKDGETINEPVDRDNHYIDATRYAWSDVFLGSEKVVKYTDKESLGIF